MSKEKNYNELIVKIMAQSSVYAEDFGVNIIWERSVDDIMYEISEIENNEVTIYFNIDKFCSLINDLDCNDAIMIIYTTLYSRIGQVLGTHFHKCKKISKLAENESEIYKFACSFCENYSGVGEKSSKLRNELEMTNQFWKLYEASKEAFPVA